MTNQPDPLASPNGIEISQLECPIDSMFLIHKALRNEAARVEEMVRTFDHGSSVQPIRAAFNLWAVALAFHAQQEDIHMTGAMEDFPPARDNESEHTELENLLEDISNYVDGKDQKDLRSRVIQVMEALREEQHMLLLERLEDVMAVLNEEIGKTRVIARTQRHLYQRVVALRVAQDDHLECEEEFVLPEIRQRFDDADQLKMMRWLFIDDEAEDKRWMLDWVGERLTTNEHQVLKELENRLAAVAVGS